MYVDTQCGSLYVLCGCLWKHDLKSLNYASGQIVFAHNSSHTHTPLHPTSLSEKNENTSHSFSQKWLTFRKTERRKQMGRRKREVERDSLHSDK